MNGKKISIIACVNNDRYWEECLTYLRRLIIPDGYEIEILEIRDAVSMCAGYNEGMNSSDAKYKVYMHQDVFITDIWFLCELIDIFNLDESIGMVGLVGSVGMPEDAVVWHGPRVSRIYRENNTNIDALGKKAELQADKLACVDGIDGLLMATAVDLPWREDVFSGWDFYDLSQSREFINRGYKVVVPDYDRPFAVHDDGMVLNLVKYDYYRERFINTYYSRVSDSVMVVKESDGNFSNFEHEKKVSVILPCYNVEKWIDRCLQSIIAQTVGVDNLEIICVDDCSTDSTMQKLMEWESRYPDSFVIVESPQNGRQGQARNIGLEYANCEWIAFVDSDDWVEPDYIEQMLNAADDDYDIICCGYERDFAKELVYFPGEDDSNKKTKYVIGSEDDRRPVILNPILKYNAWAKLIRKDFLLDNELLFPINITYEDSTWGSLVHLYFNKACILDKKLYHYFVNDSSTVLTNNSNHHLDCITAQTIVWKEYDRRGFMNTFRYELEIEHIFSGYLPAIKMCILRYEKPDYNIYLLCRELMIDRIGNYKENPYVKKGYLSELHELILVSLDKIMSRDDFNKFAENLKIIGI